MNKIILPPKQESEPVVMLEPTHCLFEVEASGEEWRPTFFHREFAALEYAKSLLRHRVLAGAPTITIVEI